MRPSVAIRIRSAAIAAAIGLAITLGATATLAAVALAELYIEQRFGPKASGLLSIFLLLWACATALVLLWRKGR